MCSARLKDEISVMEAVDELSKMAELDLLSTDNQHLSSDSETQKWLDPRFADKQRETIKKTFRVLHNYFLNLWERERVLLKDPSTQRGIQAIMLLVGEAAEKVDRFTPLFEGAHGGESIIDLKEYQELQEFYRSRMVKKVPKFFEIQPLQESVNEEGFKHIATVKRDQNYELFTLKNKDGKPFFNPSLLRHMLLLGEFDETFSLLEGEEVFAKIKEIRDEEAYLSAKEILRDAALSINAFYKQALQHKTSAYVSALNKAIMALMLASDSRNRMTNLREKCCLHYYNDFQTFLRRALCTEQYQTSAAQADITGTFDHTLVHLTHLLCGNLFMHTPSRKQQLELIRRLIQKTGPTLSLPFSKELLADDLQLRTFLKSYPNGPLLKTLDALRLKETGFDPFLQGNPPAQLFRLSCGQLDVSVLHLPSPVRQEQIETAEVVDEFKGFLRFVHSVDKNKCHLVVNLQDRTSWQEAARCRAIEKLQHESEFSSMLKVVTLPKNSFFYLQEGEFPDAADAFMNQFYGQIFEGESFYLPAAAKTPDMEDFVSKAMTLIHRLFFGSKSALTESNRRDFIEIFYQLFVLKLIEVLGIDSLSFTCKDGIDVGAAAVATFFSFMRVMSHPSALNAQEKDFVRFLMHCPALMQRERPIEHERLIRAVNCIAAAFETEASGDHKEMGEALSALYDTAFFTNLKLITE